MERSGTRGWSPAWILPWYDLRMKYRVQAHVTYLTKYHIIWIPKYRRKVLITGVKEYFEKVMDTFVSERYPDLHILERSVQEDHVHLFVEIPPKYSVSTIVGQIKAHTSRIMRQKFEYLSRAAEMWSVGYFVSTVGTSEKIVRDYIRSQERQDTGRAQLVLGEDTTGEA